MLLSSGYEQATSEDLGGLIKTRQIIESVLMQTFGLFELRSLGLWFQVYD